MNDQDTTAGEGAPRTVTITGKDGRTHTFPVRPGRDPILGDVLDVDAMEESQRQQLIGMLSTAREIPVSELLPRVGDTVAPAHLNQPVTLIPPPSMIVDPALVDALVEALRPVIADEIERALIRFHTDKGDQ